jgi:uncharacterized membrane protein YhaH (DUF805 family)
MKQYFSTAGTAGRSEYWGVTILSFIAMVIALTLGLSLMSFGEATGVFIGGLIILIVLVAYVWLFVAVTIKRCREIGISAWWTAACFLPYVGFIPWIVLGCIPPEKKGE